MIRTNRFSIAVVGATMLALTASILLMFASGVRADVDPPACTATGGSITLTTYRADGVTPVGVGNVSPGETIKYKATLGALPSPVCAYQGGTWSITTPDGISHDVTPGGGIPRIGGTGTTSLDSILVSYIVNPAHEVSGNITASTLYSGGVSHRNASDSLAGPTLGTSEQTPVIQTPTVTTNVHDANHGVVTSAPIGSEVHDNAAVTFAGGPTSTGTVDFAIFNNTTCSGATSSVQAGVALVDGVAESNATTTMSGGLSYKVHYNGDSNYTPADGMCEPLTTTKLTPTVTTTIHNANEAVVTSVPAGSVVHDSATVSGSGPTPTGTVTFMFFSGPGAGVCDAQATSSGTVALNGSGVAHPSSSQGPLASSTYAFRATYSGDANYVGGVVGPCEPLTVQNSDTRIQTTPSAGGPVGTVLNDSAVVSGGSNPTGSVTFKLYAPGDSTCAAAPVYTEVDATAPYATNPGYTSTAVGIYRWTADYSGDASNNPASSGCQEEQVTIGKNNVSIATLLSTETASTTTLVHDSAMLTGATSNASGTVAYTVYTNSGCSAGARSAGTKNVTNGVVPDSDALVFSIPGTYYWQAVYSGDSLNSGATSPCRSEILVVSGSQSSSGGDCPADWKPVGAGWVDFGRIVGLNRDGRLLSGNNPCPLELPLPFSPGPVKPTGTTSATSTDSVIPNLPTLDNILRSVRSLRV